MVQLQEEMKQVKAEREEYRSLQKQREDTEMQDDIRSIWSRDQIQANLDSDKDITKVILTAFLNDKVNEKRRRTER